MAGPYDLFKTDENLETGGVVINYGEFKIKIARAGGSNKKYAKVLEAKSRPYRRAIQAGTMDDAVDQRVFAEVYAEAVVLGWEGVTDKEGAEIEFTKSNVVKVFMDLPDLFADIREQASKVSTFKSDVEKEEDAGN